MLYASAETSDSLKAHQAAMVKMLKLFELLDEKNKISQSHAVQMHSAFDGLYKDGEKRALSGSAKEKFVMAMQDMVKVVSESESVSE
jgi:hypothetical protein